MTNFRVRPLDPIEVQQMLGAPLRETRWTSSWPLNEPRASMIYCFALVYAHSRSTIWIR